MPTYHFHQCLSSQRHDPTKEYFQYGKVINKGHESPALSVLQRKWDKIWEANKLGTVMHLQSNPTLCEASNCLKALTGHYRDS